MIDPKYRTVRMGVKHNSREEGFYGQAFLDDGAGDGWLLTKLVVKK